MQRIVTVHASVPRGVLVLEAPKSRDIQREMMHFASFLCITKRVAVNGVNSNRELLLFGDVEQ